MTKKLDRKTLEQPDRLTSFFSEVRTFIETHRKKIYMGSGIFLLIFVLTAAFYLYRMNYEKKATNLYNKVLNQISKPLSPEGEELAIKGFKDLYTKYPRSSAAVLGHYHLGNLYAKHRQNEDAVAAYSVFIKHSPPGSDLVTVAYNALGALEEQKKNLKKALGYYELALKTKTASSFEALNYSNMARIHAAMNDNEKAAEFYRKALSKTSDPVMTLLIKGKLSVL
jgi:tetratricopeptide (TPR) repeat protein